MSAEYEALRAANMARNAAALAALGIETVPVMKKSIVTPSSGKKRSREASTPRQTRRNPSPGPRRASRRLAQLEPEAGALVDPSDSDNSDDSEDTRHRAKVYGPTISLARLVAAVAGSDEPPSLPSVHKILQERGFSSGPQGWKWSLGDVELGEVITLLKEELGTPDQTDTSVAQAVQESRSEDWRKHYEHTLMRCRTMKLAALSRRTKTIERALGQHCLTKLEVFAEVLDALGHDELAREAREARARCQAKITSQ